MNCALKLVNEISLYYDARLIKRQRTYAYSWMQLEPFGPFCKNSC